MTPAQTIRMLANVETLIVLLENTIEEIDDRIKPLNCDVHDAIAERLETAKEANLAAVRAVRRELAKLDALEVK